ncbi:PPC domain-containing protein [Prosthecobacter sp.]|uniref:PPC domain-containing protein n=1 Tax=Prosthecobacter sp. TaxID=1965333 RepID=UPI00378478A0
MKKSPRLLAFVILHSAFVLPSFAAPPGFESLFPAGGQAGVRVETTVSGKGLEKGTFLGWCSSPQVVVLGGDKPKKFFLNIAKEAAPGPCLVRIYNDTDASPPRIIEVGKFEEVLEKEPNDTVADAKTAEARMNVTINGVFEKAGDVDTFALRAQKGKRITLELHGYSLGSPMDPAMRLLNDRGVEIAGGHDSTNLDPRIEYTPTADGTLYAQLFAFVHPPAADVSFKGSANHVYRLIATDEARPALVIDEPKTLTPPATVNGCLSKAGEEDTFTFPLKKGLSVQISVRAQSLHSPVDPTLRIEDAKGKTLQVADDADKDSLDAVLRFKSAEDGDYKLVIADRFHHGGADHVYELSVKPSVPTVTATLDTHAYHLDAGKSVEVKLTIKTNGTFTGKIKAQAANLPMGVTAEAVDVPAKGGEVKLTLKAAAEVAASQSPFAVEILTSAPDAVETVTASYAVPFVEPRGDLLITTDTHPWLTVVAKKP